MRTLFSTRYSRTRFIKQTGFARVLAILGILIFISNIGCKKATSDNKNDEYYVKYVVSSTTVYTAKMNVTITNEKNQPLTISVNQNTKSEIIIGPVQNGFNTKLKAIAVGPTNNQLRLYSEIHVSKNSGPFAIKAINGSDTPRDSVELNYTIDF